MKLTNLLNEILTEVSIEQLEKQFVDSGKISSDVFTDIKKASGGKSAYATWLAKRVLEKNIKEEDIYKYEEYLKTFEKHKKKFPKRDIMQIKDSRDVVAFTKKAIEIQEKDVELDSGEQGDHLVSKSDIMKLEDTGTKLLGSVDGYQVFEVTKGYDQQKWKTYRDVLGRCAGRDKGASISICTIADAGYFKDYINDGPFYVFFNMKDPKSPYQFHYEYNLLFRD